MKRTIKRLEKMGLTKEKIQEITGLTDEQYSKYRKQGRQVEIENLPETLDFVLKGGSKKDLDLSKMFDEIFKANGIETLEISTDKKAELIKEFPSFIKYIEIKKLTDKITSLNIDKEKLVEKINNIDKEIRSVQMEIDIINCRKKVEERIKKQTEIPTFARDKDFRVYRETPAKGLTIGMKKELYQSLNVGDLIDIAGETGIDRYEIRTIHSKYNQLGLKFIENIMTKKEEQ